MEADFLVGLLLHLQQQPSIVTVEGLPPDAKAVAVLPMTTADGSAGMAIVIESTHLPLTPPGQPLPVLQVTVSMTPIKAILPETTSETAPDDSPS